MLLSAEESAAALARRRDGERYLATWLVALACANTHVAGPTKGIPTTKTTALTANFMIWQTLCHFPHVSVTEPQLNPDYHPPQADHPFIRLIAATANQLVRSNIHAP
jgi:hypothetical protein